MQVSYWGAHETLAEEVLCAVDSGEHFGDGSKWQARTVLKSARASEAGLPSDTGRLPEEHILE